MRNAATQSTSAQPSIAATDPSRLSSGAEWLETDGLGGFASGSVDGVRRRRYHALLIAAMTPPTGRVTLINGFDAFVRTSAGEFALTPQHYRGPHSRFIANGDPAPGIVAGADQHAIESFTSDPWPTWRLRLPDGTLIEQSIFLRYGASTVVASWRLLGESREATLRIRPFFSGRDYHSLHFANDDCRMTPLAKAPDRWRWRMYDGIPALTVHSNGVYRHDPHWYRNFFYEEEYARGFPAIEDLASPGEFTWDLAKEEAVWIAVADEDARTSALAPSAAMARAAMLREKEIARRGAFATRLDRAADQYLVRRGDGVTIIAGYPWFTDWGRDTFIAMRGLCLATGRLEDAARILLSWCGAIDQGMVPNRFPDAGEEPEYNAADASLWFVIVVGEFLEAARKARMSLDVRDRSALRDAVVTILEHYSKGTRYNICADSDGLLGAGVPGQQLTWMDARVDGREITPRIGKPVEVQALWLNALRVGAEFDRKWRDLLERGRASFAARFWNEERGYLNDVIDANHVAGAIDPTLRPNQILAVGGLPLNLMDGEKSRRIVEAVARELLTPLGLRSLPPTEPAYIGRYEGGPAMRDGCYHQGTVWPWLMGPFVEAWIRVRGESNDVKREARDRFLAPLIAHLDEAGLGHVSEIADADAPHTPRGCPFQAWSLGELLRLDRIVLAADRQRHRASRRTPRERVAS